MSVLKCLVCPLWDLDSLNCLTSALSITSDTRNDQWPRNTALLTGNQTWIFHHEGKTPNLKSLLEWLDLDLVGSGGLGGTANES